MVIRVVAVEGAENEHPLLLQLLPFATRLSPHKHQLLILQLLGDAQLLRVLPVHVAELGEEAVVDAELARQRVDARPVLLRQLGHVHRGVHLLILLKCVFLFLFILGVGRLGVFVATLNTAAAVVEFVVVEANRRPLLRQPLLQLLC